MIKLVPEFDRLRPAIQTAAFTVLTLIFAGIALNALLGELTLEQSTVQIVFVGLATLTEPHMVLVGGICRSRLGKIS